jgi:hypothetical protein
MSQWSQQGQPAAVYQFHLPAGEQSQIPAAAIGQEILHFPMCPALLSRTDETDLLKLRKFQLQ